MLSPPWLYVCIHHAGLIPMLRLVFFFWWRTSTTYRHVLNMYYSVSTARCVFAMSPSLWINSWDASKENGGEKIVFARVDGAWVSGRKAGAGLRERRYVWKANGPTSNVSASQQRAGHKAGRFLFPQSLTTQPFTWEIKQQQCWWVWEGGEEEREGLNKSVDTWTQMKRCVW